MNDELSFPWNGLMRRMWIHLQKAWWSRPQPIFAADLSFSEMAARFPERNQTYAYAVHYYAHHLPARLREHRNYFKKESRGFGEDAFHAMWWLLLREYQPLKCLEVGVYRGQAVSLWALISKINNFPCEIYGISPFSACGDSVSTYLSNLDYLADTLASFKRFNLPAPTFVKAFSSDPAAIELIASCNWDLIYIDGCHDFEIVLADYKRCREHLVLGGLLVMDDASLGTAYRPPRFSFGGHPGPSRVSKEIAMQEMKFLGAVGHMNVFQKRG